YLNAVGRRLRDAGYQVQSIASEGHPATKIASLAREMDARIIAMATHGRSGLARYVLGSVASEVLHRATTPLLVARPARVTWHPAPGVEEPIEASDAAFELSLSAREARLLTEAVELLLS